MNVGKRTKILATLGAAEGNGDRETIARMLAAGADGFRINFSHARRDEVKKQIKWIREIAGELRQKVFITADLAGPKIRLGELKGQRYNVKAGDELGLIYRTKHNGGPILPIQYDIAQYVSPRQHIFLFDGKVEAEIMAVVGKVIKIKALSDGYLTSRNGINLPDSDFVGDALTAKDLADLEFILAEDFDYIGLSFVHTADDITTLRKVIANHGSRAKIIAKIETKAATKPGTLDEIVLASDGAMVARGDMAYEIGAELVPAVQWRIVELCKKHRKFSIVATQMLASMVDEPRPTRAEISDVATAVVEGANITMLSEETALGSYPVESVAEMRRVIVATERHLRAHLVDDRGKK
jgi:pyruvate kinase